MNYLEEEIPLCDVGFDASEKQMLDLLSLTSMKPIVLLKGDEDINNIISLSIDKADYMFFYTSGAQESHAWFVPKGTDIISCAAKIHTDLARGFIKGDVVKYQDYLDHHNFNECKTKGVAKMVDKDYIVSPHEVIEIRFNV
jgi:ribosome-binding ATPase YchF (GTP1/OBG family)